MRSAALIADWRRFGDARFRVYHYLALCQGVVMVLAGFEVIIPMALAMGAPPPVALMLGVLPLMGGMGQLAVPRLLNATDGNLRGLTVLLGAVAEPRGFWFAGLAILVASGLVTGPIALLLLGVIVAVSSVLSSIVAANLLAWHSAVLPESDRRLVVPRLMAVSLGIGALLLFPIAAALDLVTHALGLYAYAIPLLLAGTLGVAQVFVMRRLRRPGKVVVPPRAVGADGPTTRELDQFLRISVVNALGMGFTPALSVYAISILGLTAGFSMMVSSVATLTMVVAAAVAGARLARGSAERMLRNSFGIRAVAMVAAILAVPGTATAPAFLLLSAMLASIGFAAGSLAANERLFRLIQGPAVIRHHARYMARTSGAMTASQVVGAAIVAFGYPAFVALYAASGVTRVVAFALARPASVVADATVSDAQSAIASPATAESGASAVA